MDASAEWVMAWMDLILDSTVMGEAVLKGDLAEVRARARSIATRARRHGFADLSERAVALVEQLGHGGEAPASVYAKPVGDILRQVDAIGKRASDP